MPKDTIINMTNGYVPVRINIENDSDVASRFGVTEIPAIVIADSYGIILEKIGGYRSNFRIDENGRENNNTSTSITLSKVSRLLMRYPKDITLINKAQVAYSENADKMSALFELSEAYLLTSVYAQNSAKTNFITESQTFLRRTKKMLKKSKNKEAQQRYEILDISQDIFRQKPEKGLENLVDYNKRNKISSENQSFVHTALYLAYKKLNKRSKAEAQMDALKAAEDGLPYVQFIINLEEN